jgi:hypothetical protein
MSAVIFNQGLGGPELGRGVAFKFANGVIVSFQAHRHSYAERDFKDPDRAPLVEVAAWYDGGGWATNDALGQEDDEDRFNDVLGHQTPDEVLAFMVKCAALPSKGGAR